MRIKKGGGARGKETTTRTTTKQEGEGHEVSRIPKYITRGNQPEKILALWRKCNITLKRFQRRRGKQSAHTIMDGSTGINKGKKIGEHSPGSIGKGKEICGARFQAATRISEKTTNERQERSPNVVY